MVPAPPSSPMARAVPKRSRTCGVATRLKESACWSGRTMAYSRSRQPKCAFMYSGHVIARTSRRYVEIMSATRESTSAAIRQSQRSADAESGSSSATMQSPDGPRTTISRPRVASSRAPATSAESDPVSGAVSPMLPSDVEPSSSLGFGAAH
eukprot:1045140-Prymnesium_polylepis.2